MMSGISIDHYTYHFTEADAMLAAAMLVQHLVAQRSP
jgi:hypothetical protein